RPRAEPTLRVKKQPPTSVPPLPICKLRCQRNHVCLSFVESVGQPFLAVLLSSVPAVSDLSERCVKSFPLLYPAFFFSAPSSVITFPRSFTTPFSAPVGIRRISSNNPVI